MSVNSAPFRNPLIVALDVDGRDEALRLADGLAAIAGGFKLGPRLCLRYGRPFVGEIAERAPVFLDNKHFDIPSTMEAAVRASFDAGASTVTIHALAGAEAMKRMAEVEAQLNAVRPFRVLAVTILTSWDEQSVPPVLTKQPIAKHVTELAGLASGSGLKSLVCSPHELDLLGDKGLFLVTPGIRLQGGAAQDQKRIMTPAEALKKGASALVVGRPIVEAKDPAAVARDILSAVR